jgi:hypothetical protein
LANLLPSLSPHSKSIDLCLNALTTNRGIKKILPQQRRLNPEVLMTFVSNFRLMFTGERYKADAKNFPGLDFAIGFFLRPSVPDNDKVSRQVQPGVRLFAIDQSEVVGYAVPRR